MGALFEFLAALVVALATATFALFGVAADSGDSGRASAEAPRVVKRSPVTAAAGQTFVAVVRR